MVECQMPDRPITEEEVATVLKNARTVAVVGISHKEERDSNKVAKYLQEHGYRVIPVNPDIRKYWVNRVIRTSNPYRTT